MWACWHSIHKLKSHAQTHIMVYLHIVVAEAEWKLELARVSYETIILGATASLAASMYLSKV